MTHERTLSPLAAATLIGFGLLATSVLADDTGTIFCAAQQAVVCPEQGECTRGLPAMANLPSLFKINLDNDEVVSLAPGSEPRTSKILYTEKVDGRYLVPGRKPR
ncbi:hypothetical protein [Thiococcus pfennigii]|uniref:hypothetical protein n=1 Tax=Thiococcus pfennigii TaxID=1057 RepID=UPI0019057AB5|nr:hypothetical protein [Thiococcus pfennigii]MBK1731186.1 hypothetical protein [Thiococcus pfennigii]